jgi:monoamine oxidase
MTTRKSRVLIIGAGAAGIAAATRLLAGGIDNMLMLEAEDRIGGRIHSVGFDGSLVDLGAEWCHGEKGNIVFDMVKHLNLLEKSFHDYTNDTFCISDGTIIENSMKDFIELAEIILTTSKFVKMKVEKTVRYRSILDIKNELVICFGRTEIY